MKFHPLAEDYPLMETPALKTLGESMKANGQREPIWVLDRQILDGRNRFKACEIAGIEPVFADYEGPADEASLRAFIEDKNEHRRHLTVDWLSKKREERVKRVAEARQEGKSIRTIAEEEGVSVGQVQRDVEKATVSGDTVAPPSGKVKGKDKGREQPASRPRKPKPSANGHPPEKSQVTSTDDEHEQAAPPDAPQAEAREMTAEEEMKAVNTVIESFCRQFTAFVQEHLPDDPWLNDDGTREGALRKFDDGCSMLRRKKCVSLCPNCNGTKLDDGKKCRPCHGTGRVPKHKLDMMV